MTTKAAAIAPADRAMVTSSKTIKKRGNALRIVPFFVTKARSRMDFAAVLVAAEEGLPRAVAVALADRGLRQAEFRYGRAQLSVAQRH